MEFHLSFQQLLELKNCLLTGNKIADFTFAAELIQLRVTIQSFSGY